MEVYCDTILYDDGFKSSPCDEFAVRAKRPQKVRVLTRGGKVVVQDTWQMYLYMNRALNISLARQDSLLVPGHNGIFDNVISHRNATQKLIV